MFYYSVDDDGNDGGMDLWVREARIFNTARCWTNFQYSWRGRKRSGGGTSSGLMSFLKSVTRAAGAINQVEQHVVQLNGLPGSRHPEI